MPDACYIDPVDERDSDEGGNPENSDSKLDEGIDSKRILLLRNEPGKQKTTQAHPAHVSSEQNP